MLDMAYCIMEDADFWTPELRRSARGEASATATAKSEDVRD